MSSLLLSKIFLIASMVSLALLGVYIFISSQIKKEKEMAHINNDTYYPDGVFHDIDENGKHRMYDAFGEFYIRDTDHEKVYTKEFDRWYDPYLELEKPDRKPKELKRKIDIDK